MSISLNFVIDIVIAIAIAIVFEFCKSKQYVIKGNELLQKTHPDFYKRMGKIAMKKKLLVSK